MVAAVETMAYVGEVPWHGLGNQVEEGVSIEDMTVQAGLNWTVSKRPVLFAGTCVPGANNGLHTFKDRFVITRDIDERPYSVVSSKYKPVQPKEIMEFYRDLAQLGGFKLETAGSLSDGKRIWALARTGDAADLLGQDKVEEFLLLATSYDGTFATLAPFTDVRVVCQNTLAAAMREFETRITIPHLREFNADEVKERMGIHKDAWEARRKTMELLARTKVDVAKAREVIYKIYEAVEEPVTAGGIVLKTHADNSLRLFTDTGMGSDLESANDTAWGVVCSITEYVDHWKRARGQNGRLNSAWFGEGAKVKQRAWDESVLLAA